MPEELGSGRFYDLSSYQKNSGFAGIFNDIFDSRPEQTLGGAALGLGRDLLSKPESAEQKLERAQENDMACQIAADTIAVIPKVKALSAGVTRATMLINPHQSVVENSGAFSLNVGEGMALNYVGKSMLPGSGLQKAVARNVESAFSREIASHLSVGAGFGLVKSSFDTNNWTDKQGNFTPGKLATNVLKSTAAGAALNVPAGMIGVRTMKGSMAALAQVEAPQRLATTIAAAGSGYTSGAVFGGIDAISQGKSFTETLSAMHFAGKVGLVTGGFVGSLDNGALHSKQRALIESLLSAKSLPVQENSPSMRTDKLIESRRPGVSEDQVKSSDAMPEEKVRVRLSSDEAILESSGRQTKATRNEKLDYAPVTEYRLSQMMTRLKNPRQEIEVVYRLKPDAAKKTFNSIEEFHANMEPKEVPVRVYDIEGHSAKLVIEESLALKMDQVKTSRLKLENEAYKQIPFDNLPMEHRYRIMLEMQTRDARSVLSKHFSSELVDKTASVLRARQQLTNSKPEPLPEDFIVLLDEVPNRGKIRRLVLSEQPCPQDPWNKQKFKDPNFESAATASQDGDITFHLTPGMPTDRPTLRSFMGHEFGHLAANGAPEEAGLHYLAIMVDKDVPNPNYAPIERTAGSAASRAVIGDAPKSDAQFPMASPDKPTDKHFARNYARTNPSEDGAVHLGEEMLAPDSDRLVALGQNAPVRTTLLARSLTKAISAAKSFEWSTHAGAISERMRYVADEVYPEAVKLLERRVKHGSAAEQAASAELLGHLGSSERHTPILRKLASDPSSNIVPAELPELAGIGSTAPRSTTNGGKRGLSFSSDGKGRTVAEIAFDAMLKLQAGNTQNQFVLMVNEANPKSPTRDIALTRLGSAVHDSAPHYLKLAKLSGNPDKLPELIELMGRMPETDGRLMVFHEAQALGAHSQEFSRSLIGRALEIPGVASKALEVMNPQDAAMFEPQLIKLTKQVWDKPAQEKARTLLSELSAGTDVGRVMLLLRSDNPKGVQQGLQIVLATKSADTRLIEPLVELAANAPEATSKAAHQALMRFTPQMVKFHAHNQRRRGNVANPEALDELISRR